MIKCVNEIMVKEFTVVDALHSVRSIQELVLDKGMHIFPVKENNKLVGVLTYKNIINAHPNRIAADAMSTSYHIISLNTPVWKAKELFLESNCEVLLVVDDNKQLAGYLTLSQINEEIGKYFDSLTGLYRSDYVYYHGARLISNNTEISILFIDINNFGFINKVYGHINGDIILKELASLLKKNIPDEVFISRFGGDEFIIVTPYHIEECKSLANRLIAIISQHLFPNKISVTISAGIAGGRRYSKRCSNVLATMSNLINIASLESTKAKNINSLLSVAQISDVCVIA